MTLDTLHAGFLSRVWDIYLKVFMQEVLVIRQTEVLCV
jgi:hypothetical protein